MANVPEKTGDITVVPVTTTDNGRKSSRISENLSERDGGKKQSAAKSMINFLYNPRQKTVLGRGALNWGK